jgi:hypothetical protein
MKARELIEAAKLDPARLEIVRHAFNLAWTRIEPDVPVRTGAREAARLKLARVILRIAYGEEMTAELLHEAALDVMFAAPTELISVA